MELKLKRLKSDLKATIGFLYIDEEPYYFTLEDAHHDVKILHKTRIPSGRYEIKLREAGSLTKKYEAKFGKDFHKGMLHLQNVPNYEWIYMHFGNTDEHTDGCILVGTIADLSTNNKSIGKSVAAYKEIYAYIANTILMGEKVYIEILDE